MTIRRFGLLVLVNSAVFVALLLIIEGTLGYATAIYRAVTAEQVLATRRYITHDAELGWTGRPLVSLPDFYGPGRALTTDARGFRLGASPSAGPVDRVRVVCSGDSFTFGAGVGDTETWCAQLEALDPGLHTTNAAVIGYGLDQAYLAYRNNATLEHDVQILAFITDNVDRMGTSRYLRNPKPYLGLQGEELTTHGVPVPRSSNAAVRFLASMRDQLRTTILLQRLHYGAEASHAPEVPDVSLQPLVGKLLADLAQIAARRSQTVLLVYLPTQDELQVPHKVDAWRSFFSDSAAAAGLPYLDLHAALMAPGAPAIDDMFIPEEEDTAGDGSGPGHYTTAGHRLVAAAILERLRAMGALLPRPY
jgi:hypothetical protein